MTFKSRLTAPDGANKWYRHKNFGGYNKCIHIAGGSCLPNCVGYAWGRIGEITGKTPTLSTHNAETWFSFGDGYHREPAGKKAVAKLGAVACWRKGSASTGKDGYGHVAVVEKYDNTYVWVSESNYYGARFNVRKLKRSTMRLGNGYTFQGYIYPCEGLKLENEGVSHDLKAVARKVIRGDYGNGAVRKARLRAEGYSEEDIKEIQKIVNDMI